MDEIDETEIDPAVAETMGFKSFGTQPGKKRKFNSSDGFTDHGTSRADDQAFSKAAAAPNTHTAVERPKPTADIQVTNANSAGSDRESPQALRNGVRNESGDTVIFLPSFLEDPWKHLR